MRALVVVQIYFTLFKITSCEVDAPEVKTKQGGLRGVYRKTWKGGTFRAFTGVPYAKPPTGELRFKPPVPAEPWDGILDATGPHNICPQLIGPLKHWVPEGDEDCLYLNVYSPLEECCKAQRLPVMFYIHGGRWMTGNGNAAHAGPDYLLEGNIVLVVINYRIGAFGFLSTEDKVVPGNNGLKDQLLALKWVRRNIKYFGGDPKNVTLVGHSTGAVSVIYHLISPQSRGLFRGAIAMSGSVLASWALAKPGAMITNAKKLAEYLHCPINTTKHMIQCLKQVDAYDIVELDKKFYVVGVTPFAPYMPVVEEEMDEAFLAVNPIELFKSGRRLAQVPLMIGITSEDGAILSSVLHTDFAEVRKLDREFNHIAPKAFQYEDCAAAVTRSIKKFYFGFGSIDEDTKDELTKFFTDYFFAEPVERMVRKLADKFVPPIYYYLFAFEGSRSLTQIYGDPSHNYGVSHYDEFFYLLSRDYFKKFPPNKSEKALRDIMVTLWTNFAKFGNPTPQRTPTIPVIWNRATSGMGNYYCIGGPTNITMQVNLYDKRMQFWQNVWHKNKIKVEL